MLTALKREKGRDGDQTFKVLNCFSDYISMGEGSGRVGALLDVRANLEKWVSDPLLSRQEREEWRVGRLPKADQISSGKGEGGELEHLSRYLNSKLYAQLFNG
jgi:hypothetical protein